MDRRKTLLASAAFLFFAQSAAAQSQTGSGSGITQLTGDVTATGPGSAAATVAAIQGTTVTGTTGTGAAVLSTSPTLVTPSAAFYQVGTAGDTWLCRGNTSNVYTSSSGTICNQGGSLTGAAYTASVGFAASSATSYLTIDYDTYLNRQSAGVFGMGTSSSNALGSLDLANETLTGTLTTSVTGTANNALVASSTGVVSGLGGPPALSSSLSTTNSAVASLSTSASTGFSTANSNVTSLSTSASTGVSTALSGVTSLSTGLSTTNSNVTSLSTAVAAIAGPGYSNSQNLSTAGAAISWIGLGSYTTANTTWALTCHNLTPAASNGYFLIQVGTGATPTWSTSGYVVQGTETNGGTTNQINATADVGFSGNSNQPINATTTLGSQFRVDISNLAYPSSQNAMFSLTGAYQRSSSSATILQVSVAGASAAAAAITAIRVVESTSLTTYTSANFTGTCTLVGNT